MANTNVWRQEYEEGVEIPMPHRPLLDENGEEIVDDDGYTQFVKTRVRSLSAGYILKSGKVPSGLMEVAQSMLIGLGVANAGKQVDPMENMTKLEALNGFIDFQEIIVKAMVVYPKIVDKPKADDEISFEMLSTDDLYFYLALIDAPLDGLRRFRRRPGEGVESVPESQDDAPVTE